MFGVTDQSALYLLVFLSMTFFGNSYWLTPIANAGTKSELSLVHGFSYLLLFIITLTVCRNIKTIFDSNQDE